ncbi:MAG: hypothetical protein BWY72_01763 [Bacteroidetes bacterium ADurb.Bin416]|nr:MAG: hypothetical protein BWY72_01763 [Bacteroidetes bacterium ADurb.Bin416]
MQDALGSQDHFHFRRPDTESDGTHGTVGGRVGVSANNGHAGLCQSVFRADDVDNSVLGVSQTEKRHSKFLGISGECFHLVAGNDIGDGEFLIEGGDVVVRHAKGIGRPQHGEFPVSQSLKSLRTGHFVAIMPVDVQLCGTVFHRGDHVFVPDFVEKCFTHILLAY